MGATCLANETFSTSGRGLAGSAARRESVPVKTTSIGRQTVIMPAGDRIKATPFGSFMVCNPGWRGDRLGRLGRTGPSELGRGVVSNLGGSVALLTCRKIIAQCPSWQRH